MDPMIKLEVENFKAFIACLNEIQQTGATAPIVSLKIRTGFEDSGTSAMPEFLKEPWRFLELMQCPRVQEYLNKTMADAWNPNLATQAIKELFKWRRVIGLASIANNWQWTRQYGQLSRSDLKLLRATMKTALYHLVNIDKFPPRRVYLSWVQNFPWIHDELMGFSINNDASKSGTNVVKHLLNVPHTIGEQTLIALVFQEYLHDDTDRTDAYKLVCAAYPNEIAAIKKVRTGISFVDVQSVHDAEKILILAELNVAPPPCEEIPLPDSFSSTS